MPLLYFHHSSLWYAETFHHKSFLQLFYSLQPLGVNSMLLMPHRQKSTGVTCLVSVALIRASPHSRSISLEIPYLGILTNFALCGSVLASWDRILSCNQEESSNTTTCRSWLWDFCEICLVCTLVTSTMIPTLPFLFVLHPWSSVLPRIAVSEKWCRALKISKQKIVPIRKRSKFPFQLATISKVTCSRWNQ